MEDCESGKIRLGIDPGLRSFRATLKAALGLSLAVCFFLLFLLLRFPSYLHCCERVSHAVPAVNIHWIRAGRKLADNSSKVFTFTKENPRNGTYPPNYRSFFKKKIKTRSLSCLAHIQLQRSICTLFSCKGKYDPRSNYY